MNKMLKTEKNKLIYKEHCILTLSQLRLSHKGNSNYKRNNMLTNNNTISKWLINSK